MSDRSQSLVGWLAYVDSQSLDVEAIPAAEEFRERVCRSIFANPHQYRLMPFADFCLPA